MNKQYILQVIFLLGVAFLVVGCGEGDARDNERDLSTPSSRIVGHWYGGYPIVMDKYFSPVDNNTKIGTVATRKDQKEVLDYQYLVVYEDLDGVTLVYRPILYQAPDLINPHEEFWVDKDGLTLTNANWPDKDVYNYVGPETTP